MCFGPRKPSSLTRGASLLPACATACATAPALLPCVVRPPARTLTPCSRHACRGRRRAGCEDARSLAWTLNAMRDGKGRVMSEPQEACVHPNGHEATCARVPYILLRDPVGAGRSAAPYVASYGDAELGPHGGRLGRGWVLPRVSGPFGSRGRSRISENGARVQSPKWGASMCV